MRRPDRDRRSMLLVNSERLALSDGSAPLRFKINGGTGSYLHAHGTITARNVGNNTDFTITVTY